MSKVVKKIAPYILILILTLLLYKKCSEEPEIKEVRVEIPVVVPSFSNEFKVFDSKPLPNISGKPLYNRELLKKYEDAKDSIEKLELYKEAVTKRNYKEVFNDSIQEITVGVSTTGTMDSLWLSYKTHPREIKIDTVIPIEVPKSLDRAINLYVEGAFNPSKDGVYSGFKYGIDVVNRKGTILGLSRDTDNYWYIKFGKRFKF